MFLYGKNTKTMLSKMSRWKPTPAGARGLHKCIGPLGKAGSTSDDARVSRSSRGKKSIVGGRAATGQKLGHILGGGG